ncbi:M14 family metallopeptidase [Congregibacter sp.]|uniref:M14 family metallopeptidase n=1 Tax=Congregibacter sp. TaxID=2744308 RepID=UPI00386504AD
MIPSHHLNSLLGLVIVLCLVPMKQGIAADLTTIRAELPPVALWSGASEALIAQPDDAWITPAERDDFKFTPSYQETRQWLERLVEASPSLSLHSFGHSAEGRELFYIKATPVRDDKGDVQRPVVLIQAGIHSHEIDGKDAGLMLLRDIGLGKKSDLIDVVDLVFVPIYNVDGHERPSAFNAAHLRGPANHGTRDTAQSINLNRDYAKAEAPETRAMLALIQELDPVLYIDVHVSDGFDHGYDVTYTYAAWGRYMHSKAIADWLNGPFEAGVNAFLRSQGHNPHFYPSAIDYHEIEKGLRVSGEGPRWSTGYGDHIRMPTVLVEMHNLKPYRQRVLGAYSMMEGALRAAATHLDILQSSIEQDRQRRPDSLVVRWERDEQPMETIPFKGMAFERYESAVSGAKEIRYLGHTETWNLPVTGQHPVAEVKLPQAWWIPASERKVIALMDAHGILYETIDSAIELELDTITMHELKLGPVYDTRVQVSGNASHAVTKVRMPAGSVRVSADQTLGLLAASLLEPEAMDSLFSWGFFPQMHQKAGNMERFIAVSLAESMLEQDPELRDSFETELAKNPEFAADPKARLRWFQDRSGYGNDGYGVYPIKREL